MIESNSDWNAFTRVNASQRWRRPSAAMGREATAALVTEASVEADMRVLDVASGSGEPAISIAAQFHGTGAVFATDISTAPLNIARQRAAERELSNLTVLAADVHELPFLDSFFDRVTCRLGIMFFSDPSRAFLEVERVLKSGGRFSVLAWGPMEQPYFDLTVGTVTQFCPELRPLLQNVPMFKFADPAKLGAALRQAGFASVNQELIRIPWNWPSTPEELWAYFQDVTIPFRPLFKAIPIEKREIVDSHVIEALSKAYDGSSVNFEATMLLASAAKH